MKEIAALYLAMLGLALMTAAPLSVGWFLWSPSTAPHFVALALLLWGIYYMAHVIVGLAKRG